MSAADLPPDDLLAAEYVLGLLDGEALFAARARLAHENEFAARVAWWEDRLAPLLDELGGAELDAGLWARIEQALDAREAEGTVVALKTRLRRWQAATALAAAASVAALALAAWPMLRGPAAPPPAASSQVAQAPLVSSIPITGTPLRLVVTYLPDRQELLVSAAGLTSDGVHDHELWLVPAQGGPQSLGVIQPGAERGVPVRQALARQLHAGATLAISREPLGGKPPQAEVGPIVGQGTLTQI